MDSYDVSWVGKPVFVVWHSGRDSLKGTVLHQPAATGDSWVIMDSFGLHHRIMNFDRMSEDYTKEPDMHRESEIGEGSDG